MSARWYRLINTAAFVLAFVLTLTTAIFVLLEPHLSPKAHWLLQFLNLSRENSLAAWYSGMLLLVAGVLCYDGWILHRNERDRIARSWLLLAAILVALSLDEVGSFHERLELMPYGIELGLLPAGLLLLALVWYCVAGFRTAPDHAGVARWCVIAFVLYATVPVQELVELRYATTPFRQAVSIGLEEGTEVAATTLLLSVALRNTLAVQDTESVAGRRPLELSVAARRAIIPLAVVAVPVLAVATANVTDQFRGRPADWLTASMLVLAALAELRAAILRRSPAGLVGAILLFVASMSVVFAPLETLTSGIESSRRAVVLTATLLLLATVWTIVDARRRPAALLLAASCILHLVIYELIKSNLLFGYVVTEVIAIAAYLIVTRWQDSVPRPPGVKAM